MTELPVKSLRTTFRILEALVERNGATISELADEFNQPDSTLYDHLTSLLELEYVIKQDGEYRLSSNFLRMGDLMRQEMDLYQASSAELHRLANQTGEYASLVVEEHGQAIIIATEEGEKAIPVRIFDGIRMQMHTAAPGKAILAFLSDEHIDDIIKSNGLRKMTENTITDQDNLYEELVKIRKRKYALDDEERLIGMRSVAVPIIDRSETVRGSLSIYGPTNRIQEERFREELPDLLLRSGNIVEVLMNYE